MQQVFARKLDAKESKGIRGCSASALSSVMVKWCASVLVLMMEKLQEPPEWSSQHIQVLLTNFRQTKPLGMASRQERKPDTWCAQLQHDVHGQFLDIKTAFDVARLR